MLSISSCYQTLSHSLDNTDPILSETSQTYYFKDISLKFSILYLHCSPFLLVFIFETLSKWIKWIINKTIPFYLKSVYVSEAVSQFVFTSLCLIHSVKIKSKAYVHWSLLQRLEETNKIIWQYHYFQRLDFNRQPSSKYYHSDTFKVL